MNDEFSALSRGLLRHSKKKTPDFQPGDRELDALGNPRTIGRSGCTPAEPYPPNRKENLRQGTKNAMQEKNKKLLPLCPGETVTYVSELSALSQPFVNQVRDVGNDKGQSVGVNENRRSAVKFPFPGNTAVQSYSSFRYFSTSGGGPSNFVRGTFPKYWISLEPSGVL